MPQIHKENVDSES